MKQCGSNLPVALLPIRKGQEINENHFNMMSMRSVLPFNDSSSEWFSSKNIQGDQKKKKRPVLIRSLVLKILIDFSCKWRRGALLLLPPLGGGILSHLEAEGVFWGPRSLWPFYPNLFPSALTFSPQKLILVLLHSPCDKTQHVPGLG